MNIIAFCCFLLVLTVAAVISWYKVRKRKIASAGELLFAGKSLNYTAVGTALFLPTAVRQSLLEVAKQYI